MAQIGNILAQINARTTNVNLSPWIDDFDVRAKDVESIVYDAPYDVLACIVAALDAGVPGWEIGEAWKSVKHTKDFDGLRVTAPNDLQIQRANQIRKHYRNKLTILALKSQSMSNFRVDLQELLNLDPRKFKLKFLPMMIRLPSFYAEDQTIETLKKKTVQPAPDRRRLDKQVKTLKHVDTIYRKTKNAEAKWYWFVDDKNLLHRLSIDGKNKLNHVFEKFLDKPLQIEGHYPVSSIRGTDLNFFSVEGDWKLL